ncbi:MAG TPA: protein kinase, partial [Candidatus Limnocylindrales bacterium]|nr:protein kinase [Candidatus Limnocylindrales bacterium]
MTPERWRRVDELFHSALEREPAERAALLSEACAGDDQLRRAVEKLIAAHEKDGSFIDSPAYADTELLIDDLAVLTAGQLLGPYKVIDHIGSGGMGEVYLAEDIRLGRRVALKLLRAEFIADKDRLHRFQQEARTVSSLNHPNILTIHEVSSEGGTHFMATEYVEGETLRQHMADARIKLGEALDVAIQVASGLAAAHEAGIVHRDIKPENVMVRTDRYVKVLDFGLAKLAEPKPVDTLGSTLPKVETEPGLLMGTVSYMSPEQARGLAVDARTDIWSLGVMLYEMVVGRQPFEGNTTSDVMSLILQKEPPPLVHSWPEVPVELEQIVRKALRKDKEERYQTVKDLLIDLRSLTKQLELKAEMATLNSGQSNAAIATSASSAEYIATGIKRHWRVTTLILVALGIAVAAATYFYYLRSNGATINSMAVLPFVNDGADPGTEYLSDGITESLTNSLSQLPNLRMIAHTSTQRYKGPGVDPPTVARELGVQAVLTGRVVRRGDSLSISAELVDARDNSHIWGEQYNRRLSDILAMQQEIVREIAERLRARLTGEEQRRVTRNYTENVEAYRLYSLGRYYWNKRTSDGFKKAIENFEQAIAIDPEYALAYAGLGDANILMGYFGALPMKEAMPKAKQAATRALEIDAEVAEAHASLANIAAWYEWDSAASEREFRKAIEVNPNYPTAHHWYGLFLAATKRFDEAVQELKTAQSLDPTSLIINSDLGYTYYLARRYDDAIEQCSRTLQMDENFELAHYEAGLAYVEKGNYDQALVEFGKATSLDNKPQALAMLGYTYARAGKRREAERALAELETLAKHRFIPPNEMAIINAALGNNDKALSFLEKDYDLRSSNVFEIGVDPRMDSLRADPRFQALL